MVSSAHAVCAKGLYIAMISTTVETDNAEQEIKPALELLGDVLEMFVQEHVLYTPLDNGSSSNVSQNKINSLILIINVCSYTSQNHMMPHPTLSQPLTKSWSCTQELLAKS
jgi:RAB protein geranylgeranyltransferase component A